MAAQKKKVVVIDVWEHNLQEQFLVINALIDRFPYVSMDTEFPSTILPQPRPNPSVSGLSAALETYHYMKFNVNNTKLIQLGLTLSDYRGNLPSCRNSSFIWQFNLRDFDIEQDNQNKDSIQLLKDQGIDFKKNKENGIYQSHFAHLFKKSRLVGTNHWTPHGLFHVKKVTWVTFHSPYDFGHLIKILNQRDLPDDLGESMEYMKKYFGEYVFDMAHIVKTMARLVKGFPLYGGLEKISNTLHVDRVAGKSHQAGSDSLLSMQTYLKLKERYLRGVQMGCFGLQLSGLEIM